MMGQITSTPLLEPVTLVGHVVFHDKYSAIKHSTRTVLNFDQTSVLQHLSRTVLQLHLSDRKTVQFIERVQNISIPRVCEIQTHG